MINSSSPGWVLAANQVGRSAKEAFNSVTICGSAGRGADTYLRLPNIWTLAAPNVLKFFISVWLWAKQSLKPVRRLAIVPGNLDQFCNDRGDIRPFTKTIGMFLDSVSFIKLGQNSDSTHIAKLGCQWSRNESTHLGQSMGTNWWMTFFGSRLESIFAEVTVPVVIKKLHFS